MSKPTEAKTAQVKSDGKNKDGHVAGADLSFAEIMALRQKPKAGVK